MSKLLEKLERQVERKVNERMGPVLAEMKKSNKLLAEIRDILKKMSM